MRILPLLPLCLLALAAPGLPAADDGFVPLFNGRNLDGWVNANCAPETWSVRDGMIHCTGRPTGALRTTRQYENFILEVDRRHLSPGGNSGVFIWGTPIAAPGVPFLRGIEVQVLDHGYDAKGKNEWYTTHGDVFPIHGATMKPFGRHNGMRSFPSEERSKGSPEWNHYRVTGSNGVLRLEVNGKEVSGGEECNYRKGYLALESEGAPVEFRNVRVRELPSTGAAPELTAPLDQGWRAVFTGLDWRGWRTNSGTAAAWRIGGERLHSTAPSSDPASALWTDTDFGPSELILDVLPGQRKPDAPPPQVWVREGDGLLRAVPLGEASPGSYQRYRVTVDPKEIRVHRLDHEIARWPRNALAPTPAPGPPGSFGLADPGGTSEFMNLYVRRLPSQP